VIGKLFVTGCPIGRLRRSLPDGKSYELELGLGLGDLTCTRYALFHLWLPRRAINGRGYIYLARNIST